MSGKSIAFNGQGLAVDMGAYLSQHDVVYLTPPTQGYEGLPIGNGDMGAIGWTHEDRLHFQINKCDTWDDAPDGSFGAWDDGNTANTYTSLRHCGQLEIEPGLPMFDWNYLEDFESRLSLADAHVKWSSKGPLGWLKCNSFIARVPKVMVLNYEDQLNEPTIRKVKLARWGTRVLEHWYATIKRADHLGPGGTKAGADGDEIWIEQSTRSLEFAMAAKIVAKSFTSKVYHSREAGFEIDTGKKCEFTLYLSVVTSEESDDPLDTARKAVNKAVSQGTQLVFERHKERWTDFWSKSFIDLTEDYLTNLWYLQLYQLGSSSLGKYPPHFIGSLWSWSRDIRPWNHYYHWNQQQYTWPLHAAGHPELMIPYARWRLEGLPHAIEDAKKIHNCRGAFYGDVSNRKGYQDTIHPEKYTLSTDSNWLTTYTVPVGCNISPCAQIAGDLWRHYSYTLDEEFLTEYAYPILRECVRFYLDYLRKENDGLYHIPKADPFETVDLRCKDTTNDLAYIRWLFPAFCQTAKRLGKDKKLAEEASKILTCLTGYVYAKVSEDSETSQRVPAGTKIASGGISIDTGNPAYIGGMGSNGKILAGGHLGNAQMTSVFPTGLTGLNQEGTQEFEILKNTLLSLSECECGHNIQPICMARLGFAEELASLLTDWVDNYQHFPQGFFSYFRRNYEKLYHQGKWASTSHASDHLQPEHTNKVKVIGAEEYLDVPTAPFSHLGMEAGAILMATINEMLLQSHDGKIRVFPATPEKWDGRFTLYAIGGFIITSERMSKDIKYIAIKSCLAGSCCVINPWGKGTELHVLDMTEEAEIIASCSYADVTFATHRDSIYVIERISNPLSSFKQIAISGEANHAYKKLANAKLGKPRQF